MAPKRPKRDAAQPHIYIFALVVAVIAALFIKWLTMREPGHKASSEVEEPLEVDAKFERARANLFSSDGGSRFGRDAESKGDVPRTATQSFGDMAYWDDRYAKATKDHYDWYGTWNLGQLTIRQHVLPFMPVSTEHILQIGCGNSRLAEELLDDGYSNIVNVDISQKVVDKMADRFSGRQGLKFLQMDATSMSFENNSFDVVFEKGTLDAMYTGSPDLVRRTVLEVLRVLRSGGLFVSLSFGIPETRKELNASGVPTWARFRTMTLGDEDVADVGSADSRAYQLYLMTKG